MRFIVSIRKQPPPSDSTELLAAFEYPDEAAALAAYAKVCVQRPNLTVELWSITGVGAERASRRLAWSHELNASRLAQ
jgi:hypothetical protein